LTTPFVLGKTTLDTGPFRGWLVGHFIPPELGPRSTDAVEVKWATHALGETRSAWAANIEATTLSILVYGSIRIFFATGEEALLAEQGDYILWPPGLAHRWQIEEDKTIVLTVRWPSRAGDVVSS
jgi:hypothetical protein